MRLGSRLAFLLRKGGVPVGQRAALNLIEGAGIVITAVDDPTQNEVDVTITASGEQGGASNLPELDDVDDTATPTSGHYLRGDGTDWDNSAILDADIPATIARDTEVTAAQAAAESTAATALATHSSDTTSVHGIDDTSDIILEGDSRLTNARTPTAHDHDADYEPLGSGIAASTFNANTILKADSDNTPVALTVAEQTLLGRVTGGVIDDLAWDAARNVLGLKTVRRTTDSAGKQNNTLTDDTQLLWAVGANEVWLFEGFILLNAVNATMDAKFGLNVPAGTTGYWGAAAANNTAPPGFIQFATSATVPAMLSVTGTLTHGTLTGVSGLGISGVLAIGANAGNVVLQWAQNTTNGNDLKVLANSSLRLTRLA